jgi:hypothetical protein
VDLKIPRPDAAIDDWQLIFRSMIFVGVASLALRAPFWIDPGFSVDSYTNANGFPALQFFLAQGRIGQFLMIHAVESIGINYQASSLLLQATGIFMLGAASVLAISAFFRVDATAQKAICLASLLFVAHPFNAEILTFPEASFYPHFATFVSSFALFLAVRRIVPLALAVGAIAFSLSIYQISINILLVALTLGLIGVICRLPACVIDRRDILRSGAIVAFAALAYFVAAKVLAHLLGDGMEGRGTLLPISAIPRRLDEFHQLGLQLLDRFYVLKRPLLAILAASLIAVGYASASMQSGKVLLRQAGLASAYLAFVACGIGIVAIANVWWPVPRVLIGLSFAMAAAALPALIHPGRLTRAYAVCCSILLILGGTSVGLSIHADQKRINAWDDDLAERIYEDASVLAGTSTPRIEIANVHMKWTHAVGVESLWGDMNMSAFAVPGALPGLFRESLGAKVEIIETTPTWMTNCNTLPGWPNKRSMRLQDDVVQICI